jgi:hypothetical protein
MIIKFRLFLCEVFILLWALLLPKGYCPTCGSRGDELDLDHDTGDFAYQCSNDECGTQFNSVWED